MTGEHEILFHLQNSIRRPVNTLRPKQNKRHSGEYISKYFKKWHLLRVKSHWTLFQIEYELQLPVPSRQMISNASVFLCFLNKLSTTRSNIRITRTHFRGSFYFSHNDVIEWKHFPRCGPFVRGIQRSPVNSSHKGQWRGALMFSLICAWTDSWENNGDADDWDAIAHIMTPL